MAKAKKFSVKIYSPTEVYYDGPAVSVSASNQEGPFDVLADHANFFSILAAGDVTLDIGYDELKFKIDRGIMVARDNQVKILLDV